MWIAIHMGGTRQVRDMHETGTREVHHCSAVEAPSETAVSMVPLPARSRYQNVIFLRKLRVLLAGAGI